MYEESRVQASAQRENAPIASPAIGGGASGAPPAHAGSGGSAGTADATATPPARADASTAGTRTPVADPPPPACSPPAVDGYCARVPPLAVEPVIDGSLDCAARALELTPVGWNGMQPKPAQHRTLLATAARADGLYVYVEVHGGEAPRPHPAGSDIYCGDAVEIYVDADGAIDEHGAYSSPGTMQFIIAAPSPSAPTTIEALRFVAGDNQGAWSSTRVRTALLPDGYAVEVFISARDLELTAWEPSRRIGFDIAIDVGAPAGTRGLSCGLQLGQYFLRMGPADDADDAGICHGKPWCDTRAFCTPEL